MPMPSRSPHRPVSRARAYPAGTARSSVMTTTARPTKAVLRSHRPYSVSKKSTRGVSRGGGEEQGEEEERDGGALGQIAPLDACEERQGGQDLGGVIGPAAGQHEDHDHVGEGEHAAEEQGHEDDGADQRDGDLENGAA